MKRRFNFQGLRETRVCFDHWLREEAVVDHLGALRDQWNGWSGTIEHHLSLNIVLEEVDDDLELLDALDEI